MNHMIPLLRTATLALLLALALPAIALTLPPSESFQLDNGTQVILMPRTEIPLIAARVAIRGGSLGDAEGREGTAALLAEMFGKGSGKRSASKFVDAVANVGGELSFSAEREALWARADFLAEDAELMLELLADALQRPTLANDEFEKLRTRAIQSLAAAKDGDPRGLVSTYGQAWLFKGHPYGRPVNGDESSLARILPADLSKFYRDQVGADRAILSIAGDFDPAQMRKAVEKAFGSWRKASAPVPNVPAPSRQNGPRVLLVDKPGATQTYFWIGNLGASINDPASAAQDLIQTLFGGRFTSMLNTELRVKSGLTYGARAELSRYTQPGAAAYYSFTRTDATAQAIDLALAVQKRLHTEEIDASQLESARRYVLGQFAPDYQTNAQLAGAMANLALYDQTLDRIQNYDARIQAASADEVSRARAVFPRDNDYAMVVIGDADIIADDIAKYGPVTRMRIDAPGFVPVSP